MFISPCTEEGQAPLRHASQYCRFPQVSTLRRLEKASPLFGINPEREQLAEDLDETP